MIVERSVLGSGQRVTMDRVHDGVEAVAYVRRQGKFQNRPRLDLFLLDLKLPRMHGHEVLRTLKADDDLKMIPVVVLTTSDAEQDRRDTPPAPPLWNAVNRTAATLAFAAFRPPR